MRSSVTSIAIVGAGCQYPDAADPDRLWELVLARRRAFRPIPSSRLNLADYNRVPAGSGGRAAPGSPDSPDSTYVRFAALLDGWRFDREGYRVPGSVHRVTDLTHWLALDVAADTLEAAGFPAGRGLNRDRAGVIIGNTLTGEFTRASLMRLRWPYVRRVLAASLTADGWDPADQARLLAEVERSYKAPFPEPNDESLAGGLANTIAGRICNHFDLHGGGYTVDGACASSLLAVITACRALALGELDFALAGGVDLSLDPFELVGFARTGALADEQMRVYDAEPTGFWPGEGCGIVALMRAEDAAAQRRTPLALIRGWGVSSDGRGGLTRPLPSGQLLAQRRAYRMAGFGPETVPLFEGHGTGTAVGDWAEVEAAIAARAGKQAVRAALGSIKANIGHTKAAAGAAGLLKAALAVQHQVIPPTTGCVQPNELLSAPGAPLCVMREASAWPDAPVRAAVNALGFGGINTHVVLEAALVSRRGTLSARDRRTARRPLDVELFVFGGNSVAELGGKLSRVAEVASRMSFAEHGDLAASLSAAVEPGDTSRLRVAVTARDPAQLAGRVKRAQRMLPGLDQARDGALLTGPGLFAGQGRRGRFGLLFTGQAAPVRAGLGALGAVVPELDAQLQAGKPDPAAAAHQPVDTAIAQPAIFRSSLAGLAWLRRVGAEAHAAAGHSLGEITAACWAGALAESDAAELVSFRGRVMSQAGTPDTGMASVAAGAERTAALISGTGLVIAADNGPAQVVAGEHAEIEQVIARAHADGVPAVRLRVSHAFHSAAMAAAAPVLARRLAATAVATPEPGRVVFSTITGRQLSPPDDLRQLLARQLTAPVLFRQAVTSLAAECALLVEVGPGHGLAALASEITGVPAAALDVGAESAEGLCAVTGALFAAGHATDVRPLFAERFHRPFDIWREPQFLVNPCELAPTEVPVATVHPRPPQVITGAAATTPEPARQTTGQTAPQTARQTTPEPAQQTAGQTAPQTAPQTTPEPARETAPQTVASTVRRLIAEAVELPAEAIGDRDRMLSDLHLSSLRVTQIAAHAAVQCGRALTSSPPPLADATVADVIAVIDALPFDDSSAARADAANKGAALEDAAAADRSAPAGAAEWHRIFIGELGDIAPGGPRRAYRWQVHGKSPLRAAVEPLLLSAEGAPDAVLVFLPADPGDADVGTLIAAARNAVVAASLFAVVDEGDTASGFLATLGQEYPGLATRWVGAQAAGADQSRGTAIASVLGLRQAGHSEFSVDPAGHVRAVRYKPADSPGGAAERPVPLGDSDVILVTGGGKGIGFRSASALARQTGARLALLGRSRREHDRELRANLDSLREAGAVFRYAAADLADPAGVRTAIADFTRTLGPITAVVHSSGINEPARFADLDDAAFAAHAAAKYRGLRTVLAALDTAALRILLTYGSVIGRFGLAGEAHYALANGRMRELARVLAAELPDCWVCNIDWTAWSGAGMGERLGVLGALRQAGVVPIPAEAGTAMLTSLLAARTDTSSVVISGRLPQLDHAARGTPDPSRYLRQVILHIEGVELVAEADLSLAVDPYLADHRIDGVAVLPAVCAMEAMAAAAHALTGQRPAGITGGSFDRPVTVPDDGTTTIRICALARADGDVEVVLRSSETGFAADHFTALVTTRPGRPPSISLVSDRAPLPAHDGRALYGPLFFHGATFQRLLRYEQLGATDCVAVLRPADLAAWQHAAGGQAGPPLLGDPATNDATIHVLQGCVPHRRLLPVGCGTFSVHRAGHGVDTELVLHATERAHEGADYTYDVVLADGAGGPVSSWTGLRLRDVGPAPATKLPVVALGSYLQRRVGELLPGRRIRLDVAARSPAAAVAYRASQPDQQAQPHGRGLANPPWPASGPLDGAVLSAPGSARLGCAWATVAAAAEAAAAATMAAEAAGTAAGAAGGAPAAAGGTPWAVQAEQLVRFSREPETYALARLHTALAALDKAGLSAAGLRVRAVYEGGWVLLRTGNDDVVTAVLGIDGEPRPVVVAMAFRGEQ